MLLLLNQTSRNVDNGSNFLTELFFIFLQNSKFNSNRFSDSDKFRKEKKSGFFFQKKIITHSLYGIRGSHFQKDAMSQSHPIETSFTLKTSLDLRTLPSPHALCFPDRLSWIVKHVRIFLWKSVSAYFADISGHNNGAHWVLQYIWTRVGWQAAVHCYLSSNSGS